MNGIILCGSRAIMLWKLSPNFRIINLKYVISKPPYFHIKQLFTHHYLIALIASSLSHLCYIFSSLSYQITYKIQLKNKSDHYNVCSVFHILSWGNKHLFSRLSRSNKESFIYYVCKFFKKLTFLTPWYAIFCERNKWMIPKNKEV